MHFKFSRLFFEERKCSSSSSQEGLDSLQRIWAVALQKIEVIASIHVCSWRSLEHWNNGIYLEHDKKDYVMRQAEVSPCVVF